MANVIIPKIMDTAEKLALMRDDAKYEINSDLDAESTAVTCASSIKAPPSPAKIPKMFLSNCCEFNCAYCGCRCGREDRSSYANTPKELANLAVSSAKGNGHGVFISSAVYKNADYTQELLAETARIIRKDLCYKGYLHVKVMPGADSGLIAKTGMYASRLSINIEVAQSSGYEQIAKQKNRVNILTPMQQISNQIIIAKEERRSFAISQTTQLMAGSTNESDRTIMTLSNALYRKYRLKRVYYTPFCYRHDARGYEAENLHHMQTPYWRMARLYQADRLIQLYGFTPDDVTPDDDPFLLSDLDPKAAWALRNLHMYPVEVNKADFETLIRVPGIGITYAKRIIEARRHAVLTLDILKKIKVSLKRSKYFITCNGKYAGGSLLDSPLLRQALTSGNNALSIFNSLSADEQAADGC